MANLESLNALTAEEARARFLRCCGSSQWAERMADGRPFKTEAQLFDLADKTWYSLAPADRLEAFSHHPKIGDKKALEAKFADTRQWALSEQAGVAQAQEDVLEQLAQGNRDYEAKFGYIFIVCATGKSAAEMLALLKARLGNDRQSEMLIAAEEQRKITRLRLEKE